MELPKIRMNRLAWLIALLIGTGLSSFLVALFYEPAIVVAFGCLAVLVWLMTMFLGYKVQRRIFEWLEE